LDVDHRPLRAKLLFRFPDPGCGIGIGISVRYGSSKWCQLTGDYHKMENVLLKTIRLANELAPYSCFTLLEFMG
jgi:hypothetical protein